MKAIQFDREKVIENMRALQEKRMKDMNMLNKEKGIESSQEENKLLDIKYLGKMEFTIEGREELVERDVFLTLEEIDGQMEYRYYDDQQNLIGIQKAYDRNIMLSVNLSSKSIDEQIKIQKQLEEKDKLEAKTFEELKKEQKQVENPQEKSTKLTQNQVQRLNGPRVRTGTIVDGSTLSEIIGLSGDFIQIIDADIARELFPNIKIPTSQTMVPIEIYSDGTADMIGEDKLEFSHIEGTNSTDEHITTTNEGEVRNEQNLETFNIRNKGGMNTIAIGYDEEYGTPLEVKYGRRDITNPKEIAYSELETVHEGPMQKDDDAYQEQKDETQGIYKGMELREDAIEKYAVAMNIRKTDINGYPTSEYDLETAEENLESAWRENPDATLDELIEEGQNMPGPNRNRY